MATQIQFRRGTKSQHNAFTGAAAEVTVNTTDKSLHVHDGTTQGGFELARADLSNHSGVGVLTATTFSGNLTGNVTGNINSSGVNTATTLSGTSLNYSGISTLGNVIVGGATTALIVNGDARVTGILTIGTGSITLNGSTNQINVGTGLTITSTEILIGSISIGSGTLTGTATSTTNIPNLTGDITSSNTTTTLATVNSNVGTFGSSTAIPSVTVNAKGLITGVSTSAITVGDGILTLATSGTGLSGSASFTANQSGSSSFTVTSNATNANTASAIVARDGSGNFSAGTITANLTGTASSTTNIPNLTGAITSVNTTTSLGSFTSAQLATALTNETGSGSAVFATSPTLVTPVLGTPSSGTLTNCTGLPVSTGISGLAAGAATFLATPSSANLATLLTNETGSGSAVFATSPTLVTPVLGTPSSGTLTNCTGLPITGITSSTTIGLGLGSIELGHATDTTISRVSAGLIAVEGVNIVTISATQTLTNKTLTSPTLTTPVLGTPSSGTLTNCTFPTLNQNTTGSAATLTTGRTIAITGDLTYTSGSFNGSGNVTGTGTLATVNANVGTFGSGGAIPSITVNAKGLITGVTTTAVTSGTTITDDTSTNASRFLTFTSATSGSISAANVSSTKLTFNPSTGTLTATDINSTSDINLKENIRPIENPLNKVLQLNGVEFDWKETQQPSMGVIAQELEKVFPSLVKTAENKSVNYNGLVGVLIEAVKEQQKQIEELKKLIQDR